MKIVTSIVTIAFVTFYANMANSQISDNHLSSTILKQPATKAAGTILTNIKLLIEISEGRIDLSTVSKTILDDTETAITIFQQYQSYQAKNLAIRISSLKLELEGLPFKFRKAGKVGSSQLDDAINSASKTLHDLRAAEKALTQSSTSTATFAKAMKGLKILGAGASVFDTVLKGNAAFETMRSEASGFSKTIAVTEFAVSTAITSMIVTGAKFAPVVGLVQLGTDLTVWYTDKLGDAVYLETNERTQAIYGNINGATIRIQNRIAALYKAGRPPTDEQVAQIARKEYLNVKNYINSFKGDVGIIEWLFGVRGSGKKTIDDALFMVNAILDGKAELRAIEYNQKLRQRNNALAKVSESLRLSQLLLEETAKVIPDNFKFLVQLPLQVAPEQVFIDNPNYDNGLSDEEKSELPRNAQLDEEDLFELDPSDGSTSIDPPSATNLVTTPITPQQGFWAAADASPASTFLVTDRLLEVSPPKAGKNYTSIDLAESYFGPTTSTSISLSATTVTPSPDFNHSRWGEWTGQPGGDLVNRYNVGTSSVVGFDHIHWVYGDPTLTKDVLKIGSATFSGTIKGDFAPTGSSTVQRNAVSGIINLTADISARTLSGIMSLDVNNARWAKASFGGSIDTSNSESTLFSGTLNGIGSTGSGGLNGMFYGLTASELGGNFYYFGNGGGASGVFLAKQGALTNIPDPQPSSTPTHVGQIVRYGPIPASPSCYVFCFGSYYLDSTRHIQTTNGGLEPLTQGNNRVQNSSVSDDRFISVSNSTRGDYKYTEWGSWSQNPNSGGTAPDPSRTYGGSWIIGQATLPDDMPQFGTATYNGEMAGGYKSGYFNSVHGYITTGGTYSGNIQLNANFYEKTIGGSYSLARPGSSPSLVGIILPAQFVTNTKTVTFSSGTTTTSGQSSGSIQGAFYGPRAEEVGGRWDISGAHGTFRAKQ